MLGERDDQSTDLKQAVEVACVANVVEADGDISRDR